MNELCSEIFISKHGINALCTKLKGHQERNPESCHSGDAVVTSGIAGEKHE